MAQQEIWKDIEGYEGFYQVSNLGQVRSVDRTYEYTSVNGNSYVRSYKGQILVQSNTVFDGKQTQYKVVALSCRSKSKDFLVHRLVAQAFIPNPNNFSQVNHIDENPSNNCVDNLEWCSPSYNVNYGTRNQVVSNALKGRPKSSEAVAKMRESLKGNIPWNKGMHTRPITCLDANIEFACSDDAAAWIGGVTPEAVEYCLKREACCKGHVFVHSDNIPEDIDSYVKRCVANYRKGTKAGRPCKCIEDNKVFKFVSEAAKYYGVTHNDVYNRLDKTKGVLLKDNRTVHFRRISFEEFEETSEISSQ